MTPSEIAKRYSEPRPMYAKAIGDACLFVGMTLMTIDRVGVPNNSLFFVGLAIAGIGHFASGLFPPKKSDQ